MFSLASDTKELLRKIARILRGRSGSLGIGQSCPNICLGSSQPLVGVAQATGHFHTPV